MARQSDKSFEQSDLKLIRRERTARHVRREPDLEETRMTDEGGHEPEDEPKEEEEE